MINVINNHKIISADAISDTKNPRMHIECNCGELTDVPIDDNDTGLIDTSISAVEAHVNHVVNDYHSDAESLSKLISDLLDYIDPDDEYTSDLITKAQEAVYFLELGQGVSNA